MRTEKEINAEVDALKRLMPQASPIVQGILECCIEIISNAPLGIAVYAKRWRDGEAEEPLSTSLVRTGVVSWRIGDPIPGATSQPKKK